MERDIPNPLSQQERWLQQRIDLLEKQFSELHTLNRNHAQAYQALKQQHDQEKTGFYASASNQGTIKRAILINRQSSQYTDLMENYSRTYHRLQACHRQESRQLNERIELERREQATNGGS